jgi:hypothetical protein
MRKPVCRAVHLPAPVDEMLGLWNTTHIWMNTIGNTGNVSRKTCMTITTRVSSRRPPAVNGFYRGSNGGAAEIAKGRRQCDALNP